MTSSCPPVPSLTLPNLHPFSKQARDEPTPPPSIPAMNVSGMGEFFDKESLEHIAKDSSRGLSRNGIRTPLYWYHRRVMDSAPAVHHITPDEGDPTRFNVKRTPGTPSKPSTPAVDTNNMLHPQTAAQMMPPHMMMPQMMDGQSMPQQYMMNPQLMMQMQAAQVAQPVTPQQSRMHGPDAGPSSLYKVPVIPSLDKGKGKAERDGSFCTTNTQDTAASHDTAATNDAMGAMFVSGVDVLTDCRALIILGRTGSNAVDVVTLWMKLRDSGLTVEFATPDGKRPMCNEDYLKPWKLALLARAPYNLIKEYRSMVRDIKWQAPVAWNKPGFDMVDYTCAVIPGITGPGLYEMMKSKHILGAISVYHALTRKSLKNTSHRVLGAIGQVISND